MADLKQRPCPESGAVSTESFARERWCFNSDPGDRIGEKLLGPGPPVRACQKVLMRVGLSLFPWVRTIVANMAATRKACGPLSAISRISEAWIIRIIFKKGRRDGVATQASTKATGPGCKLFMIWTFGRERRRRR